MGNVSDEPTPDSAETRRLLERIRAGDRQAFEELFTRHRPQLRQLVELRMDPKLRARVDPSDVVQETQLEAFRRLADYLERRPMPFRLWLRKTACERLLKIRRHHVRTAQRDVQREVALPDHSSLLLAQQLIAPGSTPSEQFDRREAARLVRQAMAQLPEVDREILLMRNFEGLSNQEAAQVLQIDPATASQRFGRALLRLRKLLLDSGLMESEP
jgi:RNA polymerase sigma-70 factor (ECF subfamily)